LGSPFIGIKVLGHSSQVGSNKLALFYNLVA